MEEVRDAAGSKKGRALGARPSIESLGRFALCWDRRTTFVLLAPVPIEGQIGEQRRPAEPVIDLDIAELRVPEAAKQPKDEVDHCQEQRPVFHELRQLEGPSEMRLVLAQQVIAD